MGCWVAGLACWLGGWLDTAGHTTRVMPADVNAREKPLNTAAENTCDQTDVQLTAMHQVLTESYLDLVQICLFNHIKFYVFS